MKILLVLLGLLGAMAAGAVGALLFAPAPAPAQQPVAAPAPAPTTTAALPAEARERLDALAMEVADLQARLDRAQTTATRAPVAASDDVKAVEVVDESSIAFAALHRDAILKVISDERADQERRREEERNQRDEEQRVQRADRMAQRFGLNATQSRQLADFYGVERTKRDEMRVQFESQAGLDTDPQSAREAFRAYGEWRETELVRLFGDAGKQISELENQRFRTAAGGQGGGTSNRRGGGQNGGPGGGGGGAGQAQGGGF